MNSWGSLRIGFVWVFTYNQQAAFSSLPDSKPTFMIARGVWITFTCLFHSLQSPRKKGELTVHSHSIEGKLRLEDIKCLAQGHTNNE